MCKCLHLELEITSRKCVFQGLETDAWLDSLCLCDSSMIFVSFCPGFSEMHDSTTIFLFFWTLFRQLCKMASSGLFFHRLRATVFTMVFFRATQTVAEGLKFDERWPCYGRSRQYSRKRHKTIKWLAQCDIVTLHDNITRADRLS